jgi:hypothetical protein
MSSPTVVREWEHVKTMVLVSNQRPRIPSKALTPQFSGKRCCPAIGTEEKVEYIEAHH